MQEGFTSFWFYTGDKGAKLPPNRGMKNYFSFSEISWVFFNVLARFFLHFCRCNSEVWVAKCSSLLFTEEFVWLFALPFNKRKYLPYANPAFNGKQCTLWTAGHHTSCSVLSNGFQTHGRALSNLSGLTLHLLFSFFLSILSALKFSGKKEERKVYVKDGKRLSMVFCCAAETFPSPPSCPLQSAPVCTSACWGSASDSGLGISWQTISPACQSPSEEQHIQFCTQASEDTVSHHWWRCWAVSAQQWPWGWHWWLAQLCSPLIPI